MQIAYPFAIAPDGRLALASEPAHVEQMIEQVLFTDPGERVNRPDFGCGLSRLVFEPLNSELVAVTQALVRGGLLKWLGDLIQVEGVSVEPRESAMAVVIAYTLLSDRTRRVAAFAA